MTFLVLDVTPAVGVASGLWYRLGSNPKILEDYIHNILHIHIYKQIQVPLWCFRIWLPLSGLQSSKLIILTWEKTEDWIGWKHPVTGGVWPGLYETNRSQNVSIYKLTDGQVIFLKYPASFSHNINKTTKPLSLFFLMHIKCTYGFVHFFFCLCCGKGMRWN